jgi:hypothetical protein
LARRLRTRIQSTVNRLTPLVLFVRHFGTTASPWAYLLA